MAEQVQRHRQYEYRANSNLVLTTDHHRPRTDEPSGEPESLKDHLGSLRFGDRVVHAKPQPEKKRKVGSQPPPGAKRGRREGEVSVLGLDEDVDSYRPRSRETRAAYEELLHILSTQLGDQPHDILQGAADEVLACLKNDMLNDPERKKEIEKLINALAQETFGRLVSAGVAGVRGMTGRGGGWGCGWACWHTAWVTELARELPYLAQRVTFLTVDVPAGRSGKRITDYDLDEGGGNEKLDDELGVAVIFDEDDADDDEEGRQRDDDADMVGEVQDEEDDAGDGLDTRMERELHADAADENGGAAVAEEDELPISAIDAYWLQRECSRYFNDPLIAQRVSEEVLATLTEAEERDCENKLVILLDYDKFDLIKLLLKHRWKISVCTRLAQAQSEAERASLLASMREVPQAAEVGACWPPSLLHPSEPTRARRLFSLAVVPLCLEPMASHYLWSTLPASRMLKLDLPCRCSTRWLPHAARRTRSIPRLSSLRRACGGKRQTSRVCAKRKSRRAR